ncbi:MAG TPA: hypothetical protein VMX13_02620 [Sedimentisphaerales bacterium]|nr:hypothetical protein [Sedimentisphaerales bacterium]
MTNQELRRRTFFVLIAIGFVASLLIAVFLFGSRSDFQKHRQSLPTHAANTQEVHSSEESETKLVTNSKVSSADPTSAGPGTGQLQDQDVEMAARRSEALMEVPPHPWRKTLLANIRTENLEQTIRNFANFDDSSLAETSISDWDSAETCAEFQSRVVVRLMRVRRVLAYGRQHPEEVIPLLRKAFRESLVGWAAAFEKRQQDYANGINTYGEPDVYARDQKSCLAATYILAELGDHQALPLLAHQYRIHHPWPPPVFRAPVPPAMTLYAMHRLASSHPRDSLSPEAAQALEEYLTMAKCLSTSEEITATVWDASYSESDPRLSISGKQQEVLQGQGTMTLARYPNQFTDGSDMQDSNGIKSQRLDLLFAKLDAFISLTYPNPNLRQAPSQGP